MKNIFVFFLLLISQAVYAVPPANFDFRLATVRDVIQLVYGDAIKREFVLSDDVVNDQRLVSFRMTYSDEKLREFLKFQGYQIVSHGSVDFVSKIDSGASNSDVFVYTPKSRDADYLLRVSRDFVKGHFFGDGVNVQTANHTPDATTQKLVQTSDRIIFSGEKFEIDKLKSLLKKLDVPAGQVLIESTVFEVTTTRSDGSSLQLIGSILNSKFGVQLGGPVLSNSVTVSLGGLTGVLSALSSDTRFKTISHSSVLARSLTQGVMTVGDQVPVLGSVTIAASGLSQQSVNMVQSGVTLTATPTIFDNQIDLNVNEQISSFVNTSTGVNSSPTLNNRQLSSSVTVHDGDTIILGGLTQKNGTDTKSGVRFFDHLFSNNSADQTEIVVIMRVTLTGSKCSDCSDKMLTVN